MTPHEVEAFFDGLPKRDVGSDSVRLSYEQELALARFVYSLPLDGWEYRDYGELVFDLNVYVGGGLHDSLSDLTINNEVVDFDWFYGPYCLRGAFLELMRRLREGGHIERLIEQEVRNERQNLTNKLVYLNKEIQRLRNKCDTNLRLLNEEGAIEELVREQFEWFESQSRREEG